MIFISKFRRRFLCPCNKAGSQAMSFYTLATRLGGQAMSFYTRATRLGGQAMSFSISPASGPASLEAVIHLSMSVPRFMSTGPGRRLLLLS